MHTPFCLIFVGGLLAACSSSTPPATNVANPCATRGASYVAHFVEQSDGTCGPMGDQIITVLRDGTLAGPPLQCDSLTLDACTGRDTNCVTTSNGVTCHITVETTFLNDGSSASGSETLACSQEGRTPCTSTYTTTLTRQ